MSPPSFLPLEIRLILPPTTSFVASISMFPPLSLVLETSIYISFRFTSYPVTATFARPCRLELPVLANITPFTLVIEPLLDFPVLILTTPAESSNEDTSSIVLFSNVTKVLSVTEFKSVGFPT